MSKNINRFHINRLWIQKKMPPEQLSFWKEGRGGRHKVFTNKTGWNSKFLRHPLSITCLMCDQHANEMLECSHDISHAVLQSNTVWASSWHERQSTTASVCPSAAMCQVHTNTLACQLSQLMSAQNVNIICAYEQMVLRQCICFPKQIYLLQELELFKGFWMLSANFY